MALVLHLATLLLATTAFATPSPECAPGQALTPDINPDFPDYQLTFVYLGVGKQSFVCNTDSGAYESASFYLETYDASCLNSTSYLNGIEAAVQDYVTAHRDLSVSDLDEYMKGSYDLDNSGQFLVTQDKKIELNISEDILKGGSQTTVDLGLTSQGEGWAKLTSNDGGLYQILLVEAYPPDVTSSCGTGSSGLTLSATAVISVYTTRDDN